MHLLFKHHIMVFMLCQRYFVSTTGLPSIERVQASGNSSPHKAEQHILQTAMAGEMLNGLLTGTLSKLGTQSSSELSIKKDIPKFMEMSEFAARSSGGQIIFATDDYFAVAENVIEDSEPVFIEGKYTEYGKWMDGWETRRKRIPGHDWSIIKLAASCNIKGIFVDTAYFTGNFAPRISIQGGNLTGNEISHLPQRHNRMGTASSKEEMKLVSQLGTDSWPEIIAMTNLKPGTNETRKNYLSVSSTEVFSFIRVNIYPDGGMARLRVFGVGVPDLSKLSDNDVFDLIGMENGGLIVSYSNGYYSHPRNLIKKNRAIIAGDGWETVRRLDRPPILVEDSNGFLQVSGSEWTVIKMGCSGYVKEIVIDIKYFEGNYPYSFKIEGTVSNTGSKWETILKYQKLTANKHHIFKSNQIIAAGPFNYVKITIYPDGGISRIRLYGRKAR